MESQRRLVMYRQAPAWPSSTSCMAAAACGQLHVPMPSAPVIEEDSSGGPMESKEFASIARGAVDRAIEALLNATLKLDELDSRCSELHVLAPWASTKLHDFRAAMSKLYVMLSLHLTQRPSVLRNQPSSPS